MKGAMMGAIAGMIAGVLLAPKAGKETREDISKTYNKLNSDISEKISKIKGGTKDAYSKVANEVLSAYEDDNKLSKEDMQKIRTSLAEGFRSVKEKMNGE